MLPIRWRQSALDDFARITEYIAQRDPKAARRLGFRVKDALTQASFHPLLFRAGRVEGTRELTAYPNYIVVYQVLESGIDVLAILHARQEYP